MHAHAGKLQPLVENMFAKDEDNRNGDQGSRDSFDPSPTVLSKGLPDRCGLHFSTTTRVTASKPLSYWNQVFCYFLELHAVHVQMSLQHGHFTKTSNRMCSSHTCPPHSRSHTHPCPSTQLNQPASRVHLCNAQVPMLQNSTQPQHQHANVCLKLETTAQGATLCAKKRAVS